MSADDAGPDQPTTGHAERRGEPGEGYWAGQYRMEDGSWSDDDEPEDADEGTDPG